jgi:hypothetical protein
VYTGVSSSVCCLPAAAGTKNSTHSKIDLSAVSSCFERGVVVWRVEGTGDDIHTLEPRTLSPLVLRYSAAFDS